MINYRNIMKSTNAHRKPYGSSEPLREYKSQKYIKYMQNISVGKDDVGKVFLKALDWNYLHIN